MVARAHNLVWPGEENTQADGRTPSPSFKFRIVDPDYLQQFAGTSGQSRKPFTRSLVVS